MGESVAGRIAIGHGWYLTREGWLAHVDARPESRRIVLSFDEHPPTLNSSELRQGRHWSARQRARRGWAARVRAVVGPPPYPALLWPVRCDLTWYHRSESDEPDIDNAISGAKLVWDALEDLGILENDRDVREVGLEFVAGSRRGLTMELWEL